MNNLDNLVCLLEAEISAPNETFNQRVDRYVKEGNINGLKKLLDFAKRKEEEATVQAAKNIWIAKQKKAMEGINQTEVYTSEKKTSPAFIEQLKSNLNQIRKGYKEELEGKKNIQRIQRLSLSEKQTIKQLKDRGIEEKPIIVVPETNEKKAIQSQTKETTKEWDEWKNELMALKADYKDKKISYETYKEKEALLYKAQPDKYVRSGQYIENNEQRVRHMEADKKLIYGPFIEYLNALGGIDNEYNAEFKDNSIDNIKLNFEEKKKKLESVLNEVIRKAPKDRLTKKSNEGRDIINRLIGAEKEKTPKERPGEKFWDDCYNLLTKVKSISFKDLDFKTTAKPVINGRVIGAARPNAKLFEQLHPFLEMLSKKKESDLFKLFGGDKSKAKPFKFNDDDNEEKEEVKPKAKGSNTEVIQAVEKVKASLWNTPPVVTKTLEELKNPENINPGEIEGKLNKLKRFSNDPTTIVKLERAIYKVIGMKDEGVDPEVYNKAIELFTKKIVLDKMLSIEKDLANKANSGDPQAKEELDNYYKNAKEKYDYYVKNGIEDDTASNVKKLRKFSLAGEFKANAEKTKQNYDYIMVSSEKDIEDWLNSSEEEYKKGPKQSLKIKMEKDWFDASELNEKERYIKQKEESLKELEELNKNTRAEGARLRLARDQQRKVATSSGRNELPYYAKGGKLLTDLMAKWIENGEKKDDKHTVYLYKANIGGANSSAGGLAFVHKDFLKPEQIKPDHIHYGDLYAVGIPKGWFSNDVKVAMEPYVNNYSRGGNHASDKDWIKAVKEVVAQTLSEETKLFNCFNY